MDIPIIHAIHYPNIIIFLLIYLILVGLPQAPEPMAEILSTLYPWTKSLHVISVVAWMAGLFYLPRLFVYHVERSEPGSAQDALFQTMERRLFRVIMNPAMIAAWVFGVALVLTPGVVDWDAIWPWTKGGGIIALTWFHHWLGVRCRDFVQGINTRSGRSFRLMNEVPTVMLVIIVISVIARPF